MSERYIIVDGLNTFESDSRNAIAHLRNTTNNNIYVYSKSGHILSGAERGEDGRLYHICVDGMEDLK